MRQVKLWYVSINGVIAEDEVYLDIREAEKARDRVRKEYISNGLIVGRTSFTVKPLIWKVGNVK